MNASPYAARIAQIQQEIARSDYSHVAELSTLVKIADIQQEVARGDFSHLSELAALTASAQTQPVSSHANTRQSITRTHTITCMQIGTEADIDT